MDGELYQMSTTEATTKITRLTSLAANASRNTLHIFIYNRSELYKDFNSYTNKCLSALDLNFN